MTDASGLYCFRNLYYSPITQTFLSEDPMGSWEEQLSGTSQMKKSAQNL